MHQPIKVACVKGSIFIPPSFGGGFNGEDFFIASPVVLSFFEEIFTASPVNLSSLEEIFTASPVNFSLFEEIFTAFPVNLSSLEEIFTASFFFSLGLKVSSRLSVFGKKGRAQPFTCYRFLMPHGICRIRGDNHFDWCFYKLCSFHSLLLGHEHRSV